MTTLIKHHIQYKGVNGATKDRVVLMDKGEHMRLHARLRRAKKCNIPVKTLRKMSSAAHYRDRREIAFSETLMPNLVLFEILGYDVVTGQVHFYAYFYAQHGKHLMYIGDKS